MDTVIDEVIENMAKDGSFPGGLLDDIAGVSRAGQKAAPSSDTGSATPLRWFEDDRPS